MNSVTSIQDRAETKNISSYINRDLGEPHITGQNGVDN